MPLTVPNSARRRKKTPDEKLPERPGEATRSAQVMAPTRMKLRVRRRDNAAGGAGAAAGGGQPEEDEDQSRESGGRSSRRKNASTSTTAAAAASSSSPPSSSTASASARAVMAAEEASPDSKCPICLDRFNNLAYLDRCLHRFCFPCIQEWSHNKAECPLCKQPFASILHSVRAEDDFKEYTLRPAPANSSVAATVAMVAAMASAARSDHQMRLMLRRHRGADGETTTRRRRRERGGRGRGGSRAGEGAGVWEWYLDSPPLALPPLPHQPAVSSIVAEDSEEGEDLQEQRRGAALAERGVIFEGLTGLGGAVAPVPPSDWASRRLMTRLAARQRLQREGGAVRRLRERETVAFRRALYRCGIRVRGVAGAGNQGQQHDITAESFRRNPVHLNRLRPWLRRELTVLYGAHGSLVDIVQRIIMVRLARHGLDDTPTIEEELRPFLLARTDHFLHELVSFARSPLSLENYDLQAVYEPPAAARELDGTSSSSDSSSVIAISEGEEEERRAGGGAEERLLQRAGGVHDDINQAGSCPSLSVWDDETPGPSYSTAEPSSSLASLSFSPAPQEAANEEGAEKREEEGEEECLIVGYKKPIAERTPELVQLSSDTEEEEKEGEGEEKLPPPPPPPPPPLPSNAPPLSFLPTIPPSTSGTYRDQQDGQQKEKDGEACGRRSRARSWSGSSGRSRNSVCTLSPATPGESERRRESVSWRDRKQTAREVAREKRRRKRSRRGRERSGDRLRKSSTLYNPNRSIYPAMMRHRAHSPSPFHSSVESGSPLPPSPPDSSWEYHCSQISPLTSSVSSPSRSSSSSPLCSSPQPSSQTPPTPSLSPRTHHGEKPGGKRKYKSRHLDSDEKDPTWRPSSKERRRERRDKERRRRGREEGRRRERQRREAHRGSAADSSRRCREERSPSVEIIYEGTITSNASQPPARKRRRKRHRRAPRGSSPVIITLDSDSSHGDVNNKRSSGSSSPLSSQQTVDFTDLPPLPLVHSSGMGGALNAEIGELPVDILDRGSDGSETERAGRSVTAGPIAINNSDTSDHDVDVENAGGGRPLPGPEGRADRKAGPPTTEASASDSRLLATVVGDLKGLAAPKCDLPVNFEPSCSSDARTKPFRDHAAEERIQSFDLQTIRTSIPALPPLERLTECRVREEGKDVPPLLRRASPVQSHNRNTPPPLKHKDAGSPLLLPVCPSDVHSPHASDTHPHVDLRSNPGVESRLRAEPPEDLAVPPISTLQRHFTNCLALRGEPAADRHASRRSPSEAGAFITHPTSHPPPTDSRCLPGPEGSSPGADCFPGFKPFHTLHSNLDSGEEASPAPRSSPADPRPVNSASPSDFHSSEPGWSKDRRLHADSTSGGCRNTPPVDLHPSGGVSAEATPADCVVFSGATFNDTSAPVFVSSTGSRTQPPPSPADSCSCSERGNVSEKLPPSGVSSAPAAAASSWLVPADVCPRKPSVGVPSGGLMHSRARPPAGVHLTHPAPPENQCPSSFSARSVFDEHLNHTALLSSTLHEEGSSTVDSPPRPGPPTDSDPKAQNHIDSSPEQRFPTDTSSKHSRPAKDLELPTGRQWSPGASADAHSEPGRSAGSVWNTHTHTAT